MSENNLKKRTRRRDSRSRNGCSTCRKRKVKCDEVHPKCGSCVRLKLDCLYSFRLTWEDEAKQKGIAFGRSKTKRIWNEEIRNRAVISEEDRQKRRRKSNKPEIFKRENILFLNVTAKDFADEYQIVDALDENIDMAVMDPSSVYDFNHLEHHFNYTEPFFNSTSLSFVESPTNQPVIDGFSFKTTSIEEKVFQYGIDNIFPGCICYFNHKIHKKNEQVLKLNPYLNLIVPLAFKYQIVFKSIVAASAKQLHLLGNEKYGDLANQSLQSILSALPKMIISRQKTNSTDLDDIMATVLMLCFIDISSTCGQSWLVHLNGAKGFIKGSLAKIESTPLSKFFSRYFISHEIMGETAWSSNNIVPDDINLKRLKYDYDQNIDLVLGCSPCLISVIQKISSLGDEYESIGGSENMKLIQEDIISSRDILENFLCSMDQHLRVEDLDDESALVIRKIAEVKKLTALVYLFARVDMEEYYFKGQKAKATYHERYRRVREITKEIIRILDSLPVTSMTLLWTLFVIGIVSLEGKNERQYVLEKFTEVEKLRELASVKISRRVVQSVWSEQDSKSYVRRWKYLINGRASTISLA